MTRVYEILAWSGWIWAALFFVYLTYRLHRQKRERQRGFSVVTPEDKSDA